MTFGKCPELIIERPTEKNEIIDSFSSEKINQQVYLISSIRGSGKTVFMTEISDYFKTKDDWIVVEINPEIDMLKNLLSKLNSSCGDLLKEININLTLFNIITVGAKLENKITDEETAILKILEHLKNKNKRVLITIDEVTNNKNIKIFTSSFQIFVRNNLPVFLLMTGLYENIREIQNEKSLTFLYRVPRIELGPLNLRSIAMQYEKVFNSDEISSKEMAKLTSGYAFAFQILGYLTYKNNGNYKEIIGDYLVYLEEYSYEKIWSELSALDKKIVYEIASISSNKIKDIMESLNMDNNHFNPYRKRLIDKGILNGSERGSLTFTLPLFSEFVKDNYII